MSVKEGIGLMLLVIAFGTAPLAYFIGGSWGWIALANGVAGFGFILFDHLPRSDRQPASRIADD